MFVHWFTMLAPLKAQPLQKTGLQRCVRKQNRIARATKKANAGRDIGTYSRIQNLARRRQRGRKRAKSIEVAQCQTDIVFL